MLYVQNSIGMIAICLQSHTTKDMNKTPKEPKAAIFIRIRPSTRDLLDGACQAQQRSRSTLIDQILEEMLSGQYADINSRLNNMIGKTQ
jgi:hypothetical protein